MAGITPMTAQARAKNVEFMHLSDYFTLWYPKKNESGEDMEDVTRGILRTDALVITSHGGFRANDASFIPNTTGIKLFFFCAKGGTLLTHISTLHTKPIYEEIDLTAGDIRHRVTQDYCLDAHMGPLSGEMLPGPMAIKGMKWKEMPRDVWEFCDMYKTAVVTVRNRLDKPSSATDYSETRLSKVYELMEYWFPGQIKEYYCSFCRLDMGVAPLNPNRPGQPQYPVQPQNGRPLPPLPGEGRRIPSLPRGGPFNT